MNKIIIFDIDEKFNESYFLDHEVVDILYRLKTIDNLDIGIVSSNNIIDENLFERNKDLFKYIFLENGLVSYCDNEIFHNNSMINILGEKNNTKLINICLREILNCDYLVKRGHFIESKNNMIMISPIGFNCSEKIITEFSKHDLIYNYRINMIECIKSKWEVYKYENSDINIPSISFSIDEKHCIIISPKILDKSYCLQLLKDKYDKILFFGNNILNDEIINYKMKDKTNMVKKLVEIFHL